MGNIESIPVISQARSLVQFVCLDFAGAKATQVMFSKRCPIVSQCISGYEACRGRKDKAKARQKEFWQGVQDTMNWFPIIGHIKALVHYWRDNDKEGHISMKKSTRTSVVAFAGVTTYLLAGALLAMFACILAAVFMDFLITAVESGMYKSFRPNGNLQYITIAATKGDAGSIFDAVIGLVVDAAPK